MRLSVSIAFVLTLAFAGCREDKPQSVGAAVPILGKVELVPAPQGDVAPIVEKELARAKADKKDLVLYVGASWCEPCQRFHQAAAAGELNAVFPTLRLLEFDLDVDKERLEKAGCSSRLIPLFAVPREDGTCSDSRIFGSIKGQGAVAEITPRLKALLGK